MITSAIMWVMLGQLLGSQEKLNYLLVGVSLTSGMGSLVVNITTWDRSGGIYPMLIASPLGPTPAILGRAAIWAIAWIPASLLTFAFLVVFFHYPCPPMALVWLPLMVTVMSFSTYGTPAFLGACIARAPEYASIVNNVFLTLLMAICGVSVPVSAWPAPVQALAQIMPVTHGLHAIRLMLAGGPADQILGGVALEALVGATWFTLALIFYRFVAERGRIDGSIDFEGAN
jgi:ABC-2 type transport system permease protein